MNRKVNKVLLLVIAFIMILAITINVNAAETVSESTSATDGTSTIVNGTIVIGSSKYSAGKIITMSMVADATTKDIEIYLATHDSLEDYSIGIYYVEVVNNKVTWYEFTDKADSEGDPVTKPITDTSKLSELEGMDIYYIDGEIKKIDGEEVEIPTKNTYTVTFKDGNETLSTQTVEDGKTVIEPATPTKEGYTFNGWLNGSSIYTFKEEVTENITLTASWEKNINYYTVTFMNGTTVVDTKNNIAENGTVTSIPEVPEIPGYKDVKWYVGSTEFSASTKITSDTVVVAQGTEITYTVSFEVNGGVENYTNQVIGYNGMAVRPADPTRTGYTFDGWYIDPENDAEAFDFNTVISKDTELKAKWTISPEYEVTFKYNDGATGDTVLKVLSGNVVSAPVATRDGYTFLGWYAENSEEPFDFTNEITNPLTLTAKYVYIIKDETTLSVALTSTDITSAKVTDNITMTEAIQTSANTNICIDLNGHTITSAGTIENSGTLTINDSSEGNTGAISTTGAHVITNNSTATLTVNGGKFDALSHGKSTIYNLGGTVTINGGTFTRSNENGIDKETSGGNSYYTVVNYGTMTITDGTFSQNGHFSSMITNGYYNYSSDHTLGIANPKLTITGGSFSGGINTIKNDDGGIIDISGGIFTAYTQCALMNWNIATITGGTFDGSEGETAVYNGYLNANYDKGELTISGGTFIAPENGYAIRQLKTNAGTVIVSGSPIFKASDGETTLAVGNIANFIFYYDVATVAELEAKVEAGYPGVRLTANITLNTDVTMVADTKVDLNGHTITGEGKLVKTVDLATTVSSQSASFIEKYYNKYTAHDGVDIYSNGVVKVHSTGEDVSTEFSASDFASNLFYIAVGDYTGDTLTSIKINDTTYDNTEKSISIGKSSYLYAPIFKVDNGKLYVALPWLIIKALPDEDTVVTAGIYKYNVTVYKNPENKTLTISRVLGNKAGSEITFEGNKVTQKTNSPTNLVGVIFKSGNTEIADANNVWYRLETTDGSMGMTKGDDKVDGELTSYAAYLIGYYNTDGAQKGKTTNKSYKIASPTYGYINIEFEVIGTAE